MTKAEETKETKKRPRGPTNRSEALTCTVGEFARMLGIGLPTFLQVLFRPNFAFYSEQLDRKDVMSLYRCPQPTAGRGAGLAKGWPCRALAAIGLDTAALRHSLAIIATVICDTKVGPSSSPAQSRITQLFSLPPRMNGRTEFHSQAWYTRRRAAGRRPSEGRARGHGPVLSKPGI